jgi:hypothetical protein
LADFGFAKEFGTPYRRYECSDIGILSTLAQWNIEHLRYSSELITILKKQTFGHWDVFLHTYSQESLYFDWTTKLKLSSWRRCSIWQAPLQYKPPELGIILAIFE